MDPEPEPPLKPPADRQLDPPKANQASQPSAKPLSTKGKGMEDRDQDWGQDLKAVKADGAAAPIWLWNDAIQSGLKADPVARGHNKDEADEAFEVLQSFFLCRGSRLGVTRSYFRYIHNEYPDLHMLERVEVKAKTYLRGGKEEGDSPIPSICYKWRPRFGKVSYNAWWNSYWSSTQALAEKEAGQDAIWRVAEASWWEWEHGLALFYWRWPPEYQETI
jgi:hypothetical protein